MIFFQSQVKSRDGFQIPVSITFHKSLVMEGLPGSQNHAGLACLLFVFFFICLAKFHNFGYMLFVLVILATSPLHLYGYGAYGICCDEEFDVCRLPLLNRLVFCTLIWLFGRFSVKCVFSKGALSAQLLTCGAEVRWGNPGTTAGGYYRK
jgi:hypothetical protein